MRALQSEEERLATGQLHRLYDAPRFHAAHHRVGPAGCSYLLVLVFKLRLVLLVLGFRLCGVMATGCSYLVVLKVKVKVNVRVSVGISGSVG